MSNLASDSADLARSYDSISKEIQYRSGLELLDALKIAPGETVLDVGCGTGALAVEAARRVGRNGQIVGIDPLPLRIALAQKHSAQNLHFSVLGIADIKAFGGKRFDVVYLNSVFHWIEDKVSAVANLHHVLKYGGQVGLTTTAADRPHSVSIIRKEVLSRAPYNTHPESGPPYHVTLATLKDLFAEGGFESQMLVERPRSPITFDTVAAAIEFFEASSFGNFLGHLPELLRSSARAEIESTLSVFLSKNGTISLDGHRILLTAVKR